MMADLKVWRAEAAERPVLERRGQRISCQVPA